jgi:hypothetical protein
MRRVLVGRPGWPEDSKALAFGNGMDADIGDLVRFTVDAGRTPAPRPSSLPGRAQDPRTFLTLIAVISLAAAAIHFAVIPSRFAEDPILGVLFSTIAWGQSLWTLMLLRRSSRAWLIGGVVGASAIVATWLWARMFALPFGPTAGVRLRLSFAGLLSTILEVALAIACGARLIRPGFGARLDGRAGRVVLVVAAVAVVALTTLALAAGDATTT